MIKKERTAYCNYCGMRYTTRNANKIACSPKCSRKLSTWRQISKYLRHRKKVVR